MIPDRWARASHVEQALFGLAVVALGVILAAAGAPAAGIAVIAVGLLLKPGTEPVGPRIALAAVLGLAAAVAFATR